MAGDLLEPQRELIDLLEKTYGDGWYLLSSDVQPIDPQPDSTGKIFRGLFDQEEIQAIQDSFARSMGVASIITTTSGVPITQPSNFCRLCRDIIRNTEKGLKNCFNSDAAIGCFNPGGPVVQPCLSGGLFDAGASITIGNVHIANWLIGQVRNDATDTQQMRAYAREIQADEDAFMEALDEVTVMSTEQFMAVSDTLFLVANQMSQRAFQNLQQTYLITQLGRAERIINRSPAVAFRWRNQPGWPVEYVSENVEKLLGYAASEFRDGAITFAETLHPQDLERVNEEARACVSNRAVSEFSHDPYRVVTKTGDIKWVGDNTRIIRDRLGKPIGFEGIVYDISDRMSVIEERDALADRLDKAQRMELIGTLAGGVAHDLNNILGSVIAYPDVLLMELPANSELREDLEQIKESGEKAAIIVQDLLTLARRGVAAKTSVDLGRVVTTCLEADKLQDLKRNHLGLQVSCELVPDLLPVSGSETHLTKTIMNLVINAAEAMPSGGRIRITADNTYLDRPVEGYNTFVEGDYVKICVADQGPRLSDEDANRIFEPFYSRKVMGRSGTGLGMAVVWGTVKDHDGYVTVDNQQDQGTVFTLFLPATHVDPMDEDHDLLPDDLKGQGQKILVVDDIREQRQVAETILKTLNYDVHTVSSGEEAVAYLRHSRVDLILLDMIMDSGIDGMETYRRALQVVPDIKAVIASGFSKTDRVKEAQRLGAGRYLRKPYTMEKLAAAVKGALVPD